jgi:hypothetical protein
VAVIAAATTAAPVSARGVLMREREDGSWLPLCGTTFWMENDEPKEEALRRHPWTQPYLALRCRIS